jgi:hypothetical protein
MSGLKFVRNDGERELDVFVDTLMTAQKANIGREGLDEMRWAIMECLISDKQCEEPASVLEKPSTKRIESEVEASQVGQIKTTVEAVFPVASKGIKRTRNEAEEYMKDELQKVCRSYKNPSNTLAVNTRYLAKQHVELVMQEEWDALKSRYEVLFYSGALNLDYLFCDAYRALQSKKPFLSISEAEEKTAERIVKRRWSDTAFIEYLDDLSLDSVQIATSGHRLRASNILFDLAKEGRWNLLQENVNVLVAAGVHLKMIGTLVKAALRHLKKPNL